MPTLWTDSFCNMFQYKMTHSLVVYWIVKISLKLFYFFISLFIYEFLNFPDGTHGNETFFYLKSPTNVIRVWQALPESFIHSNNIQGLHQSNTSYLIYGNKMPTRCNRGFYCRSYCLLNMLCGLCVQFAGCCSILQTGHITLSSTPDQQLENHSTKYHRQQPLYNTPELLMMGIVVPETCWASNKICNKNLCCI